MDKSNNPGTENQVENIGERALTIKEVSNILDETPNIIRNWMKELKPFIQLKKNDSGYNVFDQEALERMKLIKQLHRNQNYSIKQIEHYFATGGESYKPVPKKGTDEILAEEIRRMREEIQFLREDREKQKEFNQALLQELKQQNLFFEKKFEELKYDREFVFSLREGMKQRRLESAEHENKTSEQLLNIENQLSEIKQNDNEVVKELVEKVNQLSNQVVQVKETMKESAATKEEVTPSKKPWWKPW